MPGPDPIQLPTEDGTPELSVVVMFTYDAELARRCLTSIARASEDLPVSETIVILNEPSDDVRAVVYEEFAGARVIESPVNTGTAVAWQLGFTAAAGEFVLLLHEDAAIYPETVPQLLSTLRAEPSAAAVGPWLDESNNEREGWGAGWLRFGEHSVRLVPDDLPSGLASKPYAVEEISSAISLWRRAAWQEIGGFEERTFPAISVEADSFAGLWSRGWSVLVDPRARGLHRSGTMAGRPGLLSGPHLRHFLGARFQRLWVQKWGGKADWFVDLEAEGFASDKVPPEAIELALERSQARRAELPRLENPPRSEQPLTNPEGREPAPVAVDAAIAERLIAAEREVIDDYTRWLIARDRDLTKRYDEVYDAYNKLSADAEQYRRDFDAVVGSRWWKLGARMRRVVGRG